MSLLNTADTVFFGNNEATAAYLGTVKVWGKAVAPVGITDQANLIDQWVASDASTAGEGNRVPSWTGRVNAIVASQATDTRQPRYFGGVGGQPGLLFAGSTLNTPYINTLTNITVYVKVYFPNTVSSTMTIACQDTGGNNRSWHFGVNATSIARFVNFSDAGVSGASTSLAGAVPLNKWFIPGARRELNVDNSVTVYAQHDGKESAASNHTSTNLQESLYISIGSRGGFTEAMNGYIGELRIYRAVHTPEQRAAIRAEMGIAS